MNLNTLNIKAQNAVVNFATRKNRPKKERVKKEIIPLKDKQKKVYLLLAIFLLVFTVTCHTNNDADFWFHYACGKYIVENHAIPKTAIGSWWGSENNLTWVSHEWLFGLIIYGVTNLFGMGSVPLFASLVIASLFTFIAYKGYECWKDAPLKTILLYLFGAFLVTSSTVGRPQIFLSWFIVILYLLLEDEYKDPNYNIFWLIPLMILWVNMHGGSWILIPFFLIILMIVDYLRISEGKIKIKYVNKKTTLKRLIVLILVLLAVSINGYGLEMYSYPFTNLGDTVMQNAITEWAQLDLSNVLNLMYLILPFIYFVYAFIGKERINLFEIIFALIITFMALRSIRFIAQLIPMSLLLISRRTVLTEQKFEFTYKYIIRAFIVLFILMFGSIAQEAYITPVDLSLYPSDEILAEVRKDNNERLYNHYNFGGYLVYKEVPVFIDGRADIYSSSNLEDFLTITRCNYGFEELLDKYNFDSYLVLKDTNLYSYLKDNDSVKLIIEDDNIAYFKVVNDK